MTVAETVVAAGGLSAGFDASDTLRVSWGDPDWLGPIGLRVHYRGRWHGDLPDTGTDVPLRRSELRSFSGNDALGAYVGLEVGWQALPFPLRTSIRAYGELPLLVFRVEVSVQVRDLGTGTFAQPSVAWPAAIPARRQEGGVPADTRSYGHQYSEFALPVSGDAGCTGYTFAPHRPPVVEPLMLIAPDGRTLLWAPLDQFHEQIIAVPPDPARAGDGVQCGWHGDIAEVPAGFASELALWAAARPRQALTAWAAHLLRQSRTQRPSRYADPLLSMLSYWTDNGAVYYYRTLPQCDYAATLERVVADLRARDVPVRSVQIDSWFYPHQHVRPVSAAGAPIVPPSGMMTWEPRADVFPDGFHALRRRLGDLPLTVHSRHFSSQSPYFERYAAWRDGEYAHPADPALYDVLMAQAASWGAAVYEQDWMVESFLGVRGLRELPGRARAWQEQLDRAAQAHGLHLQWCMATPADFFQTVTLSRIGSIRTSGDYRYLFDNGLNWVWFLQTNALARALGVHAFKDVFISHGATASSPGEPYAEVEALLASLSAGPVGIGDEIGASNRALVLRTCREDGMLLKPEAPIAALDRCFQRNAFFEAAPLIGETFSSHPAGDWIYVASFNAGRLKQRLQFRVALQDLGAMQPPGPVIAYDWRRRTWQRLERNGGWECALDFQDWDYRVLCPLLRGDVTVFGDVTKYATVADRRIARIRDGEDGVQFDVCGAVGGTVVVEGYVPSCPTAIHVWSPGNPRRLPQRDASGAGPADAWSWDQNSGRWVVQVNVGARGWVHVRIVTG